MPANPRVCWSLALALALGSCASPVAGPRVVQDEPTTAPAVDVPKELAPAGTAEIRVVGEGGAAIPADLRLAVMWGNEGAKPSIVVSPIARVVDPDGTWRVAILPAPPESMIVRIGDVGFALGYFVAYHDSDGDGTLTAGAGKPWRWPEFRGGINGHALAYATAPIGEGSRLHRVVGAHPGGVQIMHVTLTATCEGDGCEGHDVMSLGPRPEQMTLSLPADPSHYRFPNLD